MGRRERDSRLTLYVLPWYLLGDLLFANNKNGTVGGRDNMTLYRCTSLLVYH